MGDQWRDPTKISSEISNCLNQVGALALPRVIERYRSRQTLDLEHAEIRAALQGLHETLQGVNWAPQSAPLWEALRSFCPEMLALLDAQQLGSPGITTRARAFFEGLGFVQPAQWKAIENRADQQWAQAMSTRR